MQPDQDDGTEPPLTGIQAPTQPATSYATNARVDQVESRMTAMRKEFEEEIRALRAEVYEQKCEDAHAARHLGLDDFLAAAEEGRAAAAMGPDAARAAKQPPNAEKRDEEEGNGQIAEAAAAERQLIDTEIEECKKSDQAGPEMRVAEAQKQIKALERAVAKIKEDFSINK